MQCRDNGYKVRCYPVEIGCRGYASRSLTFFLNQLGIRNKLRKKLVQVAVRRASKASTWSWQKLRAGANQQSVEVAC